MRLLLVHVLCLLGSLVLLGGCGASPPAGAAPAVGSEPGEPRVAAVAPAERADPPAARALAVLHRWDDRRAAAYASGDVALLRRLYVPGSVAGARDVRTLREYAAHGLVVEDLTMQVLDVDVLEESPTRLRVHLVDRLAGGTATVGRSEVALPGGRPRSRTVTMVLRGDRWLVRSVRPGSVGRRSVSPRPISAAPP